MGRLASILLCLVFSFALIAFVEAKINPFAWLWISRLLFVVIWLGLCYLDLRFGKK